MRKQHYITIGNNLVPIDYAQVRDAEASFMDWLEVLYDSVRVNDDLVYRPNGREDIPVTAVVIPEVERVIINYPATIVFWTDGSKTVVKCDPADSRNFSVETGVMLCLAKKMLGNTSGALNNTMRKMIEMAELVNVPRHEKKEQIPKPKKRTVCFAPDELF